MIIQHSTPSASRFGNLRLDPSEQRQLQDLRTRDREVRAHEQAHKAAAGPHAAGGPSFKLQRGPDGRLYAIGGEVKLDTSKVPDDPEATLQKMRQIRRAALAPGKPSPQDRRVAAQATQQANAARRDLQLRRTDEPGPGGSPAPGLDTAPGPATPGSEPRPGRFVDLLA